jgi:hypothetical protein
MQQRRATRERPGFGVRPGAFTGTLVGLAAAAAANRVALVPLAEFPLIAYTALLAMSGGLIGGLVGCCNSAKGAQV